MPKVARLGDSSTHGGAIVSASPDTYCNGIQVARLGDSFACPIHGLQNIVSASPDVYCNSLGVARLGDLISCGATITGCSPDTYCNG